MTEKEITEAEKKVIAKIRENYPPGTLFYPITSKGTSNRSKLCTVQKSWNPVANYMEYQHGEVYGFFNRHSGGYAHDDYIMYNNKWAKKCVIVETNE